MSVTRRLHKQKRKNTCAVGALRTVLDLQLGVRVPEEALEAHASTADKPVVKYGCGTRELRLMVRGASRTHNLRHKTNPWTLRTSLCGSVEALIGELAAGRIPIISVEGTEDYHAIVVLAIEARHIKIWDPDGDGAPEWWTVDRFLSLWNEDGHQWYAVVGGA